MSTEFDAEWARILAEASKAPLALSGQNIPRHHPFRMPDTEDVYTMREQTGCRGCVFDYVGVVHGQERDRLERLCTASPSCSGNIITLFTPADYTIMVARGESHDDDE